MSGMCGYLKSKVACFFLNHLISFLYMYFDPERNQT